MKFLDSVPPVTIPVRDQTFKAEAYATASRLFRGRAYDAAISQMLAPMDTIFRNDAGNTDKLGLVLEQLSAVALDMRARLVKGG